jgi:HK97 family phage portal protein
MGLLDFWRRKPATRDLTYDQFASLGIVNPPTLSGMPVNENTALSISTFYRAAMVRANAVGGMPVKVYRRTAEGRTEAEQHALWPILQHECNPEQSPVDFFAQLEFWAVVFGYSFAEVERANNGDVLALWPVHPANVRQGRTPEGELGYEVRTDAGTVIIPDADMLVLRGPTLDGSVGCRLVQIARESLGLTLAQDRSLAAFFGNGARPSLILSTDSTLTPEAREAARVGAKNVWQGVQNVGTLMLLEGGIKPTTVATTNEQSQTEQLRESQVTEICRWVGVDPLMVYDYGRATWNNAERQLLNFLQFTLDPTLKRLEAEFQRKCIRPAERNDYYAEFTRESILRMDPEKQMAVWKEGRMIGVYSPNEVRKFLNMSPRTDPGGDEYESLVPAKGFSGQPADSPPEKGINDGGNPQPTV